MAIIKVTKSGEGLLFFDDFGNVYITSLSYLLGQASGRQRAPFILLSRLPEPASQDRFKVSPMWFGGDRKVEEGGDGWVPPQCPHNVSVSGGYDGMSSGRVEARETRSALSDKSVDWND